MSIPRTRALLLVVVALVLGAAAPASAAPLQAAFTYTPAEPRPGQAITFQAESTGGSTATVQYTWDLDGDGKFTDAEGPSAQTSFAAAGSYLVRLRARQPSTGPPLESIVEKTIVVATAAPAPDPDPDPQPGPNPNPDPQPQPQPQPDPQPQPAPQQPAPSSNQPPVARYDRDCRLEGALTFCAGLVAREQQPKNLSAALSSDPDGQIVRYEWDLDGNGVFEIDRGGLPTVLHTFELYKGLVDPRTRTVSVRVTDDDGATAVDTVTLRLVEPACQQRVSLGALRLEAACIRARNAKNAAGKPITRYTMSGPVAINGMTLVTRAPLAISVAKPGTMMRTRITGAAAKVSMAAEGAIVPLYDGPIAWEVHGDQLQGFKVDATAKLNGLRITGTPGVPKLGAGGARLGVHVALPAQFGGATSAEPIVLGSAGANAAANGALRFSVPSAALGPINLSTLEVTFDGVDLWEIKASVAIPAPTPTTIAGDAGIRSNGDFHHAGASVTFTNGVGPFGPVPIYLKRIAFRIELNPVKSECVPHVGVVRWSTGSEWLDHMLGEENLSRDYGTPTLALCGEVGFTGGPSIAGASAIAADGGLGFATFDDRPAVLRAFGDLSVVTIPVAHGEFEVHTNGYMRLGGTYDWGIDGWFSINGGMDLDLYGSKFNASAWGDACIEVVDLCRGFSGIVSSQGVAVCLRIDLWVDTWRPGIGYSWGDALPVPYLDGCDIDDYRQHISKNARSAAADGERSFELPAGLPGAVVAVQGHGAPPRFTLIGPKGERIAPATNDKPVETKDSLLLTAPKSNLTQVAISRPSGGRWRLVPEEGSAPISSLKTANGLPKADVKATVGGKGHQRTIRYRIKPLAGQTVTFVERGPSAGRLIGVAKGTAGTLRFTPADGKAERRSIVAVIEHRGTTRDQFQVARYEAPGARKPARPRNVRVRRGRGGLQIRWGGAPSARYQVRVRLSDGRRLVLPARARSLRVRGVGRRLSGVVSVRAISASGMLGGFASKGLPAVQRGR